jgi:hypothetical protein
MLAEAKRRLPPDTGELDAWTRTDVAANEWYRRNGFAETYRYLHVFASTEEVQRTIAVVPEGLTPVADFFHADIEDEAEIRTNFQRVYQCRRYMTSVHDVATSGASNADRRATPVDGRHRPLIQRRRVGSWLSCTGGTTGGRRSG